MARAILPLAAVVALIPFTSAGISFTSPKAGATLTAGSAIEVKWEESSDGPKLADLQTYELSLCAGGNTAGTFLPVRVITTQGSFAVSNIASGLIGTDVGEDSPKNAYFLKMTAVGKNGGQLVTYSDRFSYSGMKGTFDPIVKKGAADISGTSGPAADDKVVKPGAPVGDPVGAASDFEVAYTMQTGTIRYAPMQPVPGKSVTAKGNPKPLYPTSSVSIATSRLPIPKVEKTITQSQTYSVQSRENTVAAAPHPTDDMAKFLNRWKD
ncbi:hypothetical protein BDU57DRAFT_521874 [Ampelomyces quisqualis]|uniref:Uncharacterized protein n=1 Tax=Ampelomyces quisqualis TaxID=50730 RepID=A0A6A5QEC4_AMPQU|nr:hypothetical protein BDU57DRAFT_521874 [Ampelomyces quisqualis]